MGTTLTVVLVVYFAMILGIIGSEIGQSSAQ